MAEVVLTVAEIISTLNHSSLPTLIAEGKNDIAALRRLEDEFSDRGLSAFPVGGRIKVLDLFERRDEFGQHTRVLFIADKDTWVYTEIPQKYQDQALFFTDGYSIENDLYRDGQWERLLTLAEKTQFHLELTRFSYWYALALDRNLRGEGGQFAAHPNALLDDPVRYGEECTLHAGEAYPTAIYERIMPAYQQLLRGKSLLAIVLRRLSARHRDVKHGSKALMEQGACSGGVFMSRLSIWLEASLPD